MPSYIIYILLVQAFIPRFHDTFERDFWLVDFIGKIYHGKFGKNQIET